MIPPNPLKKRLEHLELISKDSMKASVTDFYKRIPPKRNATDPWTPEKYPMGKEKELYPEFAYILLSAPQLAVPIMLDLFQTALAEKLRIENWNSKFRAYRIFTIKLNKKAPQTDPLCFPGAAGYGGITDLGLFHNPVYDYKNSKQLKAEKTLYFEIKNKDDVSYDPNKLKRILSTSLL